MAKQIRNVKDKHTQVKTSVFDINEAISFLTLNIERDKNTYEEGDKPSTTQSSENDFTKNIFTDMNNQSILSCKSYKEKPINIIKNDLTTLENSIPMELSKCNWSLNLDDSEDNNSERPKSSSSSFIYSPDIMSDTDETATRVEIDHSENDFLIKAGDAVIPEDIKISSMPLESSAKLSEIRDNNCSKCLAAAFTYTHYYAQGSKYLKIEVVKAHDPKLRTKQSRQIGRISSDIKSKCAKSLSGESSSQPFKDKNQKNVSKKHSPTHRHFDTVSIDLTGSSIKYTVEQHPQVGHSNNRNYNGRNQNYQNVAYNPYNVHSNCYNQYAKNQVQAFMLPYLTHPRYCLVPMYYLAYPNINAHRNNMYFINKNQNKYKATPVANKNFKPENLKPVECTPPLRPWMTLSKLETGKPVGIFSVMCYNVLCENYATRSLYSYCPSWALCWDQRKKKKVPTATLR